MSFLGRLFFLLVISRTLRNIGTKVSWTRKTFLTSWDNRDGTTEKTWLTIEVPLNLLYSTVDIPLIQTPTFFALYEQFPEKYEGPALELVKSRQLAKHRKKFDRLAEAAGAKRSEMDCLVTPIGPPPRLMILDGRHRATMQYFYGGPTSSKIMCQVVVRRSNIKFLPEWWKFMTSAMRDGVSIDTSVRQQGN
jgi:hypothetical protein